MFDCFATYTEFSARFPEGTFPLGVRSFWQGGGGRKQESAPDHFLIGRRNYKAARGSLFAVFLGLTRTNANQMESEIDFHTERPNAVMLFPFVLSQSF